MLDVVVEVTVKLGQGDEDLKRFGPFGVSDACLLKTWHGVSPLGP